MDVGQTVEPHQPLADQSLRHDGRGAYGFRVASTRAGLRVTLVRTRHGFVVGPIGTITRIS